MPQTFDFSGIPAAPAAPPPTPDPAPAAPASGYNFAGIPAAPSGTSTPMNFAIVNGRRVPIDEATDEPTPPASLWDQANTSPLHHYFEAARKAVDDAITHAPGLDLAEAKANDLTGPLKLGTVSAMGRGAIAGGLEGALNYGESLTTPVGAVLALSGLGPESAIVKQIPALKPLINLPAVQALRTAIHTTAGAAFAAHGAGTIYDAATDPAASTSEKLQRAAQGTFELAGGALGMAPAVEQGAAYWAQQRRTAAGAASIADFKKTAPPSAAAPYDEPQLHRAYAELADEHRTTGPITTIEEARDAADRRITYYEKGINDTIALNPTEPIQTRPLDEVRAKLGPATRSDKLSKGLEALRTLDLDQPLTVERANKIRETLNAEIADDLRANGYDRAEARKVDAAFAAKEAAAESLRNGIADVLDQRVGVGGFTRATREQQGALIAVRDALQRQVYKNEARVGGTGATSVPRRIAAGAVRTLGIGGGAALGEVFAPGTVHVGAGLGAIAGKQIAEPIATAIDRPPLTRDQLIERSFGRSSPGTGLQPTTGTPPPVAPGAGPGGPGGGPGAPAAGPGLPPPSPPPAPPPPRQIAVATYLELLKQGYSPAIAKQMAITFTRERTAAAATAPAGAPRQLGTGARFVTTAAGETVPATAAGPQIPESARVPSMPAGGYVAPAVDPSSVRAVPGTYAERVDAARAAPDTVAGPKALPRDPRATNYDGWSEDSLRFAAENGIPSRAAEAQAELARRAALPPAEAAATTPAPTGATTSSAPITDFTKFTANALKYAAQEGTPEYKAAAQAEIARRKGAAADRATARQQTRAEADAAEQADLAELVAKAQANGSTADPVALHAELAKRLQDLKDLHAEFDEQGTNGLTLLRALAKAGGLSEQAQIATRGSGGELAILKELRDTAPSTRKNAGNLAARRVLDTVRGVRGVFREDSQQVQGGRVGGQSLDSMLEKLHADPRFAHITTTDALAEAIRKAATGREDSRNAIKDLAAASRDLLYPPMDESFDPAALEGANRPTVQRGGFGAGPPRPPVDPAPPPPDRPTVTRGGFGAGQPPAAPVPDVPDTPAAADQPISGTWYHGSGHTITGELRAPVFLTRDRAGAEWYATNRGVDAPTVHEIPVHVQRPFVLRNVTDAKHLATILTAAGVKASVTEGAHGWTWHAPDVETHGPYEGSNPIDVVYVPKAVEALKAAGYDGFLDPHDVLSNGSIETLVPFTTPAPPASSAPAPFPVVKPGATVDGRTVGDTVKNRGSIDASLTDYTILPGIREVQMSQMDPAYKVRPYSVSESNRLDRLQAEIRASGHIDPLIIVTDHESPYPYVLEGGHRIDALQRLGAKSFPALVVQDHEGAPPAAATDTRPSAPPAASSASASSAPHAAAEDAAKDRLRATIEDLDHQLGHPFGDRDDFTGLLETANEDLTIADLQSAHEDLLAVATRRQRQKAARAAAKAAKK